MPTPSRNSKKRYRVGIDVGGTFTDLVLLDQEKHVLRTHKVLSTPENPAIAILIGLNEILGANWQTKELVESITHGSTVATNALLERKGARTALISTAGFKDIYKIGRQNRADLYDLFIKPIPPLIFDSHSIEVVERVNAFGEIQTPLQNDAEKIREFLLSEQIDSVAISLIFSFANPTHEHEISSWLNNLGLFVSLSSDILPEFREYERTSTTLINAYVSPVLKLYLENLSEAVGDLSLRVLQSNGGSISLTDASRYGVKCILSGPAGGIAAAVATRENGLLPTHEPGLITFDMGGTSTDVSLIKQAPSVIKNAVIGGFPVAIPVLDIHTIGAGGGSIAYLDEGHTLRVGPRSAGAQPGPACYGHGNLPTVTDANLVLGKILPEHFLGGTMRIYKERAQATIQTLADMANLSLIQCAQGIIDIANIHMAKALKVISVERGEDPGDYLLVSFGGAGGLHAVDLARLVGITRVYIPATAAVFSAFGMLAADAIRDYSLTVMVSSTESAENLDTNFRILENKAYTDLLADGFSQTSIQKQRLIDARYKGQSYEITIPYTPDFQTAFHTAHKDLFGYSQTDGDIEIVNVRVRGAGISESIQLLPDQRTETGLDHAKLGVVPVYLTQSGTDLHEEPMLDYIPSYFGEKLPGGASLRGPVLIIRRDTTVVAGHDDLVTVMENGSLAIEIGGNL